MIEKIIDEISSFNNILILGFGREGKSTYKLIRKYLKDKKLTISDCNKNLLSENDELKTDKNIELILGENYLDYLEEYDLIIKSPGVSFKYIDTDKIRDRITSQINMFLKYSYCKSIGITGTKGKSTTSSLTYHVLKNLGCKAVLAGNIGIPIFDKIEEIESDTIVILELGCHQLEFVKYSPNISILLNIYEEHLDHYKSYKDYILAKLNIFKYQSFKDYQIWGLDSKDSYNYFKNSSNTYTISVKNKNIENGILINDEALFLIKNKERTLIYDKKRNRNLLGNHNLYNIAAVLCISDILNLNTKKVCDLVDSFTPLEHRMEFVGIFKGITFYNDSIATIPSATINCIKSIKDLETVIIGGLDRGVDLSLLINYLYKENNIIKTCIFLKDTGYIIADSLEKMGCSKKIIRVNDMEDAVEKAYKYTDKGKACVLSPAAASYNTYKDFEERGKDYKKLIERLGK